MNRAIMTCMSTDNYIYGVLGLNEKIQKYSHENLYVLCTQDIYSRFASIFKKVGIRPIIADDIPLPKEYINEMHESDREYWTNTFIKLNLFNFEQYDKILYVDSDMLVLGDLTPLFEYKGLSAVDDGDFMITGDFRGINSGILVIEPNHRIYQKLIASIPDAIKEKGIIGDQDVLQYVFKGFKESKEKHLSIRYNANAYKLDYYSGDIEFQVIHYISASKPWDWNPVYAWGRIMNYWLKQRKKTFRYVRMYYKDMRKIKKKYCHMI